MIVGVDGSSGSWAAAGLGAWEAKRRRVPVFLVYAYLAPVPYGYGWAVPYIPPPQPTREDARSTLSAMELRVRADHPGVTVRTTLVAGGGASALVELSRTASLVVVGSRGLGGFAGLLMGSVSAQVSAHAHTPVIVVRPPNEPDVPGTPAQVPAVERRIYSPAGRPIVVGVDGSPASAAAVGFALDEASARGASLLALYAWWGLPKQTPAASIALETVRSQQEAERMLAEALAGWSEKYPEVVVRREAVHDANAQWALIQASRDADMVVVGSRGRGGFASLLLGSVSRAVLSHAHCPVAVVRT